MGLYQPAALERAADSTSGVSIQGCCSSGAEMLPIMKSVSPRGRGRPKQFKSGQLDESIYGQMAKHSKHGRKVENVGEGDKYSNAVVDRNMTQTMDEYHSQIMDMDRR